MRKLVYTGGPHFQDGRTHPITEFKPGGDDGRVHAFVDEDWGFLRIAEDPQNFTWGDRKPGDRERQADANAQWEAILAERQAAKEAGGAAPVVQSPRIARELQEAQAKLAEQDKALAVQGEALTKTLELVASMQASQQEMAERLAAVEAKGKKKPKTEEPEDPPPPATPPAGDDGKPKDPEV